MNQLFQRSGRISNGLPRTLCGDTTLPTPVHSCSELNSTSVSVAELPNDHVYSRNLGKMVLFVTEKPTSHALDPGSHSKHGGRVDDCQQPL